MKSILIIEDDKLVGRTLASHLTRKGYDVSLAENGAIGVERYKEIGPDLVMLDIRLPDADGLDVLKRIKAEPRNAVFLVMTAYDDMKTTVEAIKFGAFEYLVKPLNFLELDLTIDPASITGCIDNPFAPALILPGHNPFMLLDGEQKWVLYRTRFECHEEDGAVAGIYPLDITLCINHVDDSHPDGGDDLNAANDCQTRTRSLLIEAP